ncbi:MAG: DEAD/DEAH box helicase [Desulfamplus sp.]|nr:DEAD/DEAH box helicase [Desulfamplus sp.]MBF0413394.1 DEAD/DEAH box helicase [Desulfamplus sp.]
MSQENHEITAVNDSISPAVETSSTGFEAMNLSKTVLKALNDVGYETPTSIQSSIIPHVLAGRDVVGQAQTGTGKTAAFALPLLSRIDLKKKNPQVLVITPTRELAIQVAESFKGYAARMKDFHVLPIYGGQSYEIQLRQLKRGLHVVVGTPGRLMDHMKRGTLDLSELTCLVLDEADEMLRMGFIDDVKWILEQTPSNRQMALFSATMPPAIRAIARQYLKNPEEITIQVKTMTADTIRQRFWMVKGTDKLDALTRILEAEDFDAILVFVRTKTATVELAEKLEARGYATEALNGDIAQKSRERTIERFKSGKIDIVVATDVAARGLDVDRISHVINYDIPTEAESYIHRIGRTGRAGRNGDAILFVSPREMWMLKVIEKTTRKKIDVMNLPTTKAITNKRIADFKQRITAALASESLSRFRDLMDEYRQENDVQPLEIAAALAILLNGGKPLFLPETEKRTADHIDISEKEPALPKKRVREKAKKPELRESPIETKSRKKTIETDSENINAEPKKKKSSSKRSEEIPQKAVIREKRDNKTPPPAKGMERFTLDVGSIDGIKAGDIVGAIANEAGLDGKFISNIVIQDEKTTVDLPEGMPEDIFKLLKKVRVGKKKLNIAKKGS